MSIELKIPMDALQDEHVAECLATLFLALGRRPRPGFEQRPSPRPPQRDDAAQAPRVVPRTSAKPAPPPAPEPDVTWEEVMATLTPQTLKFLELVREKRQVTMSQAIKALGLTNPKALGGLTGALSRKVRARGLEVPFRQAKTDDGQRVWIANDTLLPPKPKSRKTFLRKRDKG